MIGKSKSGRRASEEAIRKMGQITIPVMPKGLKADEQKKWARKIAVKTAASERYARWLPGIKRKEAKKAALANKKYNVGTDTSPVDPSSTSAVAPILYGGMGGGGYYGSAEILESGGGFSLSDIPSIVWIVLAVGVGWFLISSSGGKGKGKG